MIGWKRVSDTICIESLIKSSNCDLPFLHKQTAVVMIKGDSNAFNATVAKFVIFILQRSPNTNVMQNLPGSLPNANGVVRPPAVPPGLYGLPPHAGPFPPHHFLGHPALGPFPGSMHTLTLAERLAGKMLPLILFSKCNKQQTLLPLAHFGKRAGGIVLGSVAGDCNILPSISVAIKANFFTFNMCNIRKKIFLKCSKLLIC